MPSFQRLRRAVPLVLLVLFVTTPALRAQSIVGEQVLRTWLDEVKLDDGSMTMWTFTITYDAEAGLYTRTVTDQTGALIEQVESPWSMASPTAEEIERARTILLDDAELQGVYGSASNPSLTGGFELVREEGHPCGPGSRCLQFDLLNKDLQGQMSRLRYVVVNLQDGRIVSRDMNPSLEGNLTRFNSDSR